MKGDQSQSCAQTIGVHLQNLDEDLELPDQANLEIKNLQSKPIEGLFFRLGKL